MKKYPIILMLALVPALAAMVSCDDDSTIGGSVAEDLVSVTVDSSFTVTGVTRNIESVPSRTISQLIGCIDAKGFGELSSDVITQFMPASNLDTEHIRVENIDSLVLAMYISNGEFVGDSVAPMGITVYKLDKILQSPIYSNVNPADYYSPENVLGSTVYNLASSTNGSTSDGSTCIRVKLPLSLGRDLYTTYLNNPTVFDSPTSFAKVFPGVCIKNTYGSGRFSRVTRTLMQMYYHYTEKSESTGNDSTIYRTGNYFAVTPEVVTNNCIDLKISDKIKERVAAGEHIVMAPTGLEVNIEFPAKEIIESFNKGNNGVKVLNSLTFAVPGEKIENEFNISAPMYLLLVLEKEKENFFAKNALPDNKTSFYATYNSNTGMYNFGEMRQYILDLMAKGDITPDDYTFTITPVSATYESSNQSSSSYYYYYYGSSYNTSTLSMLTPYVASPVMAKLDLANAKIKLSFSSQSIGR